MPASTIATISSDVATGRRMKGRDGLIRWASGPSLRRAGAAGASLAATGAALPTASTAGTVALASLHHSLPALQRRRIALVDAIQQALAPRQLLRVVLRLFEEALALLGRRAGAGNGGGRGPRRAGPWCGSSGWCGW